MSTDYNNNQNDYKYDSRYGATPPPPPRDPHGAPPPPPYGAPPPHARPRRRGPSRFWLFCCSLVPGMGYMYMGLIKRGLFFMSSFFITIFLCGTLSNYFVFLLPILYIATFFDSFRIRNLIENGVSVPDNVDSVLDFASKNRVPLAVGFGVIALAGVAEKLLNTIYLIANGYYYYGDGLSGLVSIVLVVLLFYVLLFRNPRRGKNSDNNEQDVQDMR